jgi:nucleoside-diphosphate-sugar epimerase
VDVRDVALGIRLALEKVEPTRSFNLVGHSQGAAAIFQRIATQIPGASVMAAPLWVAEILSRLLGLQSKITGKPNPLPIDGVRFVAKGHHVSNARTRQELGMEFRPWEETERDVLASVRESLAPSK